MTDYHRRFRNDLSAFQRQQPPQRRTVLRLLRLRRRGRNLAASAESSSHSDTNSTDTRDPASSVAYFASANRCTYPDLGPYYPNLNPSPAAPDATQAPPSLPNGDPMRCHRVLNAYITASSQSRGLQPIPATASVHEVYKNYYMPDLMHIFRFIKTGPYAGELTAKEENWMRSRTLSVFSTEGRNGRKIECVCGFLERVCLLNKLVLGVGCVVIRHA
jgi:hypothetical protein